MLGPTAVSALVLVAYARGGGDGLLMAGCGVLVVVAAVLAWRWRCYELTLPPWAAPVDGSRARPVRACAWLAAVALLSGLLVGVLVVGPAGRLAMRLLAVTSPAAHGRITEADQVVGQITLSGTVGFFVFVGLPFGLVVGVTYALAAFVLPRGMVGGAVLGVAALVVFGSAVDPLRADNPDFDIVGPGWLSVSTFAVMAVLTGVLTAPIAGRLGAAVAHPRPWWAAWMAPVGLITGGTLMLVQLALVAVLAGALTFVAALLVPAGSRRKYWRLGRAAIRAALVVAVVVAVPGFVSAVSTIV
ncbi:MAG TPA: hypothetical protein VFT70_05525 [Nocardioides sp.]|nr:hypothetical protein [Nocardioides sp.]